MPYIYISPRDGYSIRHPGRTYTTVKFDYDRVLNNDFMAAFPSARWDNLLKSWMLTAPVERVAAFFAKRCPDTVVSIGGHPDQRPRLFKGGEQIEG
jgi:hypothetical protein